MLFPHTLPLVPTGAGSKEKKREKERETAAVLINQTTDYEDINEDSVDGFDAFDAQPEWYLISEKKSGQRGGNQVRRAHSLCCQDCSFVLPSKAIISYLLLWFVNFRLYYSYFFHLK